MAGGAVTFLLETLTGLLKYYGHLISGAENELQGLQRELGLLKSCLKEASALRPEKGPHFKEIEKQTREIIHEVEDDLDTYLTEADTAATAALLVKPKKHFMKKVSSAPKTIGMAEKVKLLRETVRQIYEKAVNELGNVKNREGFGGAFGEESRTTVKKETSTIRQDKVVGFEDEIKKITGYLMEEKTELDVICIIGMPGLGKTTLAWKIYQSHKSTTPAIFDILVWFNVSQNFNKKDLFLNILKKSNPEDMSGWSDEELHETVRKYLEKEKFLIVLDDVWSVNDWISIRNVLPLNNGMGKVVITSRHTEVGARAGARKPHMLNLLKKEASWELLQLEVFEKVDRCPVELKDMGKRIAENCGGLPLTIGVVGGILLGQTTRDHRPIGTIKNDWNKVSENLARLLKIDKDKRISDVVGLSYDVLPDELRDCFVYMGVFPEDHDIPAWTLTRLWIAEGFIQKRDGQSLVETAYEHLNDLINRNLLRVGATNPMGEVKTCRVHGVIRAFCTSKAADQNLFQEIILSNEGAFEIQKDHRRLCFHSNLPVFLSRKPTGPRVRSLLCFNKEAVVLDDELTSAIPDAFNLLRVLDSVSVQFRIYPTKLTNLIHLRYITLYIHNLAILPESISRLWYLQTLVVDTNSPILTMKANIWRMFCLRHLKTKAAIVLDQNSKREAAAAGSENLQTLTTLAQESCTELVSRRAPNIKKLAIRVKPGTSLPDTNFLTNLIMLEKLKLVMDYSTASRKPYQLPLPNYFPSNLKRLTLVRTFLDWSRMSTLAKIKTLEVLKLKDNAFTGLTWPAVGVGFPSLQRLLIADVDLVIWVASTDYFPSLTCLSLSNCENLKEIPHQIATCLRKLDVDGLRASAVDSAEKIRARKKQEQGQEQEPDMWGGGFQLSVRSICV
ncbi:hypothetical protein ABFX02_04G173700 [Erythranthe guttata]